MSDKAIQDAVRLLASELRSEWQAGRRVFVESLGEQFERLRGDDECLLDLLYHEVLIREEFGDAPEVAEFVARFPQIESQLRRQFKVHAAVDHDWRGDGFEPTDPQLLNARQQPTSSRSFDAAWQFYENVLVERGDDPLVRFQAASAFLRAGEIREILGQQDHSGALIDRAVELLEGLNAGQGSLAQRRELVFALRLQATNARHNGEATKAEAAYRRCLDITESLLRVDPNNVATVTHSGKVRISFAIMLKGEQRLDEAIEWHRESIDILRSAVARWPNEDACQIELANALNATGATLWYARRIPEAVWSLSSAATTHR